MRLNKHIADTGYCSRWGKSPEHCYTIRKAGNAFEVMSPNGSTVIARWSKS